MVFRSIDRVFDQAPPAVAGLGVPVIYGLSFGHISSKYTLPFGTRAKLDTEKQTLTMLESSVT